MGAPLRRWLVQFLDNGTCRTVNGTSFSNAAFVFLNLYHPQRGTEFRIMEYQDPAKKWVYYVAESGPSGPSAKTGRAPKRPKPAPVDTTIITGGPHEPGREPVPESPEITHHQIAMPTPSAPAAATGPQLPQYQRPARSVTQSASATSDMRDAVRQIIREELCEALGKKKDD